MKTLCMALLFTLTLVLGAPVQAELEGEQLASLGQLQELARTLGEALVRGEQGAALTALAAYGSGNYQAPAVAAQSQPALAYELIGHRELGESLYRIHLLEKYPDHARLWTLLFYRAERHWELAALQASDDLTRAFAP